MSNTQDELYADVNEDGSIEGLEASFVEVDGVTDRVDGIRTRYYDYGDGDPLVLLHGGGWIGSSNANTWSRVIEGLSDHFRVLAVDRCACGMTGNPDDPEDYVYDTELEHIISFFDTLGIDEFHVGGQSRGGGLAGRITAEIPDRVKTLTVVNSATLSPISPSKEFFFARSMQGAPTDKDSPTYDIDHYRQRYSVHEYSPHHVTDEFVKAAAWMRSRPKARETAEVWENGGEERWTDSLYEHMSYTHLRMRKGELQLPMLVYWGRDDPSVPLVSGIGLYDLMARDNPRVEMNIIDSAGHHPYREYPEAFIRRIASFIGLHEEYGYDYSVPQTVYGEHK